MALRLAVAVAALRLGSIAHAQASAASGITVVASPSNVVARYVAALASVSRPRAVTFEYTVEQLGPRDLSQRHRVYREGVDERDETLIVDGVQLSRPAIRIFANRGYSYDVGTMAPRPADYLFTLTSELRGEGGAAYIFHSTPRVPAAFSVREIAVDARTYLPFVIRFRVSTADASGNGFVAYGRADSYWVVREAKVSVTLANGAKAQEHMVWSNYQFPELLPPSTFIAPRPVATPPIAPAELENEM